MKILYKIVVLSLVAPGVFAVSGSRGMDEDVGRSEPLAAQDPNAYLLDELDAMSGFLPASSLESESASAAASTAGPVAALPVALSASSAVAPAGVAEALGADGEVASPHVHWREDVSSQPGPITTAKKAAKMEKKAAVLAAQSAAMVRAQEAAHYAAIAHAAQLPYATQDPDMGWEPAMAPDSGDTQEASPPVAAAACAGAGAGASEAARRHSAGSAVTRMDSCFPVRAGHGASARKSAPGALIGSDGIVGARLSAPLFGVGAPNPFAVRPSVAGSDAAAVLALHAIASAVHTPSAVRRSDVERLASLPYGAPTQSEAGPVDGLDSSKDWSGTGSDGDGGAGAAADSDSGDSGLGPME